LQRQYFLDGIRGWGSVAVLFYHVFCDGFPLNDFSHSYLHFMPFFNGTGAVMVFFIVSGFALAIPYFERNDSQFLKRIAVARYPRLMVPVFAISAVVHLAWALGLVAPPAERYDPFGNVFAVEPTLWHLLRFSLFDVFFNYSHPRSYAGPLWTMSVELLGSFLVLGAVALVPERLRFAGLLTLSLVLILFDSVYCLFIFGALIAHCWRERYDGEIARWAMILIVVFGLSSPFIFEYTLNRGTMMGMMCLTIACICVASVRSFFSSSLSRELGRISFPLYLVHGPVMMMIGAPLMSTYGNNYGFLVQMAVVAASITAAYAFIPINDVALIFSRATAKRFLREKSALPRPEKQVGR